MNDQQEILDKIRAEYGQRYYRKAEKYLDLLNRDASGSEIDPKTKHAANTALLSVYYSQIGENKKFTPKKYRH